MDPLLAAMPQLETLNLAHNLLNGSLAGFAAKLPPGGSLAYLNLSGNALTGPAPAQLGLLAMFTE